MRSMVPQPYCRGYNTFDRFLDWVAEGDGTFDSFTDICNYSVCFTFICASTEHRACLMVMALTAGLPDLLSTAHLYVVLVQDNVSMALIVAEDKDIEEASKLGAKTLMRRSGDGRVVGRLSELEEAARQHMLALGQDPVELKPIQGQSLMLAPDVACNCLHLASPSTLHVHIAQRCMQLQWCQFTKQAKMDHLLDDLGREWPPC